MAEGDSNVNSFTYTATGVLGDKRDTMLRNELHQRPRLARSLSRGHELPDDPNFIHGVANPRHAPTASAALSWSPSYASIIQRNMSDRPRDFLALNRDAVRAGLVTARQHANFRAGHDVRVKPEQETTAKKAFTRRLPPTMVFGVSTRPYEAATGRPTTPVYDLLANKYQDDWIQECLRSSANNTSGSSSSRHSTKPYDTRASLLRTHIVPVENIQMWKIPKFERKAAPQLNSFRNAGLRRAAYRSHSMDRIGREGSQGLGVYIKAQN